MARGLGRRLAGAVLAGAGAGIAERGRQRREDTLAALQRKWRVEDRDFQADLQREAWARQDARSAANQPLVPVMGEDGVTRYMPRSEAAGGLVPTKPSGSAAGSGARDRKTAKDAEGYLRYMDTGERVFPGAQKPQKEPKRPVLKDPVTGEFGGYGPTYDEWRADQDAADAAAAADARRAEAEAKADQQVDRLKPGFFSRVLPGDDTAEALGDTEESFRETLTSRIMQNPDKLPKELADELVAELQGGGDSPPSDAGPGSAVAGQGRPYKGTRPPKGRELTGLPLRQLPDGTWEAQKDGKWYTVLDD